MSNLALLSILGRIDPRAWDFIVPHGPVIDALTPATSIAGRYDRVALNPQPLPPKEAFVVGAAELAHEIARHAVVLEARGDSAQSFVSDAIDEWCGTPWPHKWPLPIPRPGPHPDPWEGFDVQAARLVAATVFASYADRITDDKFSAVFADGAERLADAAVNGGTQLGRTTGKPSRAVTTAAKRTTTRR